MSIRIERVDASFSLANQPFEIRGRLAVTFDGAWHWREELTGRQYEVLWLKEVEGLSGKEIAYKLGISQSAVSRHLTRGKKRLRVLLAYNLELRSQRFS